MDGEHACSKAEAKWKEVQHKISLDRAKWCTYIAATRSDDQKMYERKVFHIESQRTTGNLVVERYMSKCAKFFHSKDPAQIESMFEMFKKSVMSDCKTTIADTYSVVVLDYTKVGVLSQEMLDWSVGVSSKVLDKDPAGVLVIIAPVLENPAVENGEEGERRRIEKKLRAKNFHPVMITLIACPLGFGYVAKLLGP